MSLWRCYVPDAHRFIWMLVVKNAPNTQDYFTFVFLRDPLGRALSSYQEVSFRLDHGEVTNPRTWATFAELKQSTSSS
jgi:hypothetical protein